MLSIAEIENKLNSSSGFGELRRKKDWEDVFYSMSLHIAGVCPRYYDLRTSNYEVIPKNYRGQRYQDIFDTRLVNRFPRESELTRQWKLSQYRPWTQKGFAKAIQVITGAIFQDSGYSIIVDDKEDNEYLWGPNFEGKSLVGYVAEKFQTICSDPNGFFVELPKEPHYATSTTKVQPHIIFVFSEKLRFISEDEIIFERDEITWVVNRVGYFRYTKVGQRWVNADPSGYYYPHMLGYVPAWVAGGFWNETAFTDSTGFYDSWLVAAWADADEFVGEKMNALIVNKESSAPFIIEASTVCPSCDGAKKVSIECPTCETGRDLVDCSRCGGQGIISHNPGDRMIVDPEDMKHNLVQVITADVAACEFHANATNESEKRILRALHLHEIDEQQSAVAKEKDMETRYQFFLRISNDLFDRLLTGFIDCFLSLRNVSVSNGTLRPAKVPFTLVKPTELQVKTATDLAVDLKTSLDSKVPDYIRGVQLQDYVDKQFGGDDLLIKKTKFIIHSDILAVTTEEDKQLKLLNGAISRRDMQFNVQLPRIIDNIILEKGKDWFLTASFEVIEQEVQSVFGTIAPPLVTIAPEEVVRTDINE